MELLKAGAKISKECLSTLSFSKMDYKTIKLYNNYESI